MSVFDKTGSLHPRKSFFHLNHEKKFDCGFMEIVPVDCIECVPGDYMDITVNAVCRFNPMLAPLLQVINASFFAFFVPTRILDPDWEEIISGGEDNATTKTLPVWTSEQIFSNYKGLANKYSIWDYLGLPLHDQFKASTSTLSVIKYPWYGYNMIWNEFFRDENLQVERELDTTDLALRSWRKDYFTSALPFQQRGTAPSIPLSGSTSAKWDSHIDGDVFVSSTVAPVGFVNRLYGDIASSDRVIKYANQSSVANSLPASSRLYIEDLNKNNVSFSNIGTFDANDFRIMFQTQKWQERNARAGVRYTELLKSHFGLAPNDARLQRPQYIGGASFPVMVSEVLQTSQTTQGADGSPQGRLAGHGLVAGRDRLGRLKCEEFGYLFILMAVSPKATYQNGINRMFLRKNRFDFYWPEFAHLSEQEIYSAELFADGSVDDSQIFGYTGRYNEMRYIPSTVAGGMRDVYDYWHMGRQFATRPQLNGSFITTPALDDTFMRDFAVTDMRPMLWTVGTLLKASRPIPYLAEPGLVDHF